ncbi:MAG: YebC/PmpR family DNA-binding transcriptional regulator [Candidatus Buchananbacteria bacterium]|nr:YebC/PmpR family DNA-binding transcriptional regulator [Candidatus Buchananbacteria bacterium]
MSGHSKWATIKRTKGAADAKRASLFTKLARSITVAAKEKGGDPETNFSLRLAIEKAKSANMPKDNIERAIKRGTGEIQGEEIEEIFYEGFGPGGTALIIKALTDNRNRTSQSMKHLLSKYGGSLGGPNSVMWQFEQKGVIRLGSDKLADKNPEELELTIIDLGAQDIKKESDYWVIYTKVEDLQKVNKGIEDLGLEVEYADLEYIAKEKIKVSPEIKEKNQKLFGALDEDEDVDDYYTNLQE